MGDNGDNIKNLFSEYTIINDTFCYCKEFDLEITTATELGRLLGIKNISNINFQNALKLMKENKGLKFSKKVKNEKFYTINLKKLWSVVENHPIFLRFFFRSVKLNNPSWYSI